MKRVWLGMTLALAPIWGAHAQDVPGIEICTVDKTWERRTSCLQSNVDFLVKTINKMKSDQDQKLDAFASIERRADRRDHGVAEGCGGFAKPKEA